MLLLRVPKDQTALKDLFLKKREIPLGKCEGPCL